MTPIHPLETSDPEQKNIELCETENEVQMSDDQDDVNVNDRNENEDDDQMKVCDDADYNELELTEQCDNLVDLFDSKCPSPGDSKSENGGTDENKCNESEVVGQTKSPTSPEVVTNNAMLSSQNSEADMNDEELAKAMKVGDNIPKSDEIILLGDFNTSLSPLDRVGKHIEDKAFKRISKLLDDFNIYDVWRARFSNSRVFSWRRIIENKLVQSRIDFIFIPKMLSTFVKNIYYKHTAFSDHSFVILNFDCSQTERGPGVWIFNNMLLNDEHYVNKINDLILKEKECRLFDEAPLIWIDNLKYKIKKETQVYAKDKKYIERSEYFKLQNKFEKISNLAANNYKYNVNEFEEIKSKIKNYKEEKCKGAILRSKASWAIEGDKNSKYFLQLEKHRQESNSIKEIENDNGKLLTSTQDILNEIKTFYEKLYSCTNIDESKMEEIGEFISKTVPEDDVNTFDDDITLVEIFKSLNDDFTLTVSDKESINQTFEVLDLYSKASGAKINKQKSEIMCLGSGSISEIELIDYGVKLSAEVSQILGIYMDVATRAFNGTEKEVTDCIARTLKYAPDRLGRGREK
ncbi:unnamed protein product [Mytilus coruscus]|uniref:Endonuclease/exonuclease/phosphatase domain-containing protein n=1 Tax=Mytilus coruscus TaxID=42192 RepID=A0A6J8DDQ3_MYTCO|nr:unnamed protein product [Mytilus coruscus]